MGQAIRRKELLYRKVGRLHHLKIPTIDDRNEIRARGEYRLMLVCPPPIRIQPPFPPQALQPVVAEQLR